MCHHRNPIHCIVPPHVLKALARSDDPHIRAAALNTLLASTHIRAQREIIGAVRSALLINSVGQKHRTVYTADNKKLLSSQLPGKMVRDEGQPASGEATVDQAYDALGATYDFYSAVFNRNSIDGHGMRLIATVHFGTGFNNAFWNGKQMVFGDGDNLIFQGFTKSLDVVGHELTHGVTDFTSSLEYHTQSGALNESFSDVFGSLVKQFTKKQSVDKADWLIGAEILAPGINGVALRSMKDPGGAYDDPRLGGKDPQPKHMDDFVDLPDDEDDDNGGVHVNSGIPNHAFYLLATELGGFAWEDAGKIWFQTLLQLPSVAQFQDCADISVQVAGTFGAKQRDATRAAWQKVGIIVA